MHVSPRTLLVLVAALSPAAWLGCEAHVSTDAPPPSSADVRIEPGRGVDVDIDRKPGGGVDVDIDRQPRGGLDVDVDVQK